MLKTLHAKIGQTPTGERSPELAGETVLLWWGMFDNELYVEHGESRFGLYLPDGGPIPLDRYRAFKGTRIEKQSDRVEELAAKLSLPRAAISGRPEVAELVSEHKMTVTSFVDPDPFRRIAVSERDGG